MLYVNTVTLWFNSFNKKLTDNTIIGNQITTTTSLKASVKNSKR